MDIGSVSPEEFRKLQMKVDILQRFLTKTFGSSFLDFCKETQLSLTNGATSKITSQQQQKKPQQSNSIAASNKVIVKTDTTGNASHKVITASSPVARRPPPLLHRPGGGLVKGKGSSILTISSISSNNPGTSKALNSAAASKAVVKREEINEQHEQEYYDEGNDEDVVQFLQPETVFSDDEQQHLSRSGTSGQRNGLKRDHSVAFGYGDEAINNAAETEGNMHLPEGTECIVIESDEDQGQTETYTYQQEDEEMYANGDTNNVEDYYDEDGYSYGMEDGLDEDMTVNGSGNYTTEELHTDGNVVFGNVITSQDTGIQAFHCSFCPSSKVFKHKQSLKEHYLLNHSPTPPAFQCQCGRRFLKQSQLKRHEVVHTQERPFVCPICLKDFTRKDNMTVHMVRNHSEKKHACPYCPDKIYATPAEVNRHLRMYHSQWQQ